MKSVGRVILTPEWNPKRRKIVQVDTTLYVLSECCEAEMEAMHKTVGKVYLKCGDCGNLLEENPEFWSSKIVHLQESYNDAPAEWAAWGLYMLGLKDFGMTVKE